MMPGVGFEEMILLVVMAIIVVGPKDLPLMMRKFGRFTGKMRAMAFEFKQGIDELGRQAELEELRKEVANLKAHTGLDDIKRELEEDRAAIEKDINEVMKPIPAPVHPAMGATGAAAAAAGITEVKPEPLPYAGLSPDHPGYDMGEDFRIDGYHTEPTEQTPTGVQVVEDDVESPDTKAAQAAKQVAPEPVKQDTPA